MPPDQARKKQDDRGDRQPEGLEHRRQFSVASSPSRPASPIGPDTAIKLPRSQAGILGILGNLDRFRRASVTPCVTCSPSWARSQTPDDCRNPFRGYHYRPQAERWLSGRKHRLAKPAYCLRGTQGSNPCLSATSRAHEKRPACVARRPFGIWRPMRCGGDGTRWRRDRGQEAGPKPARAPKHPSRRSLPRTNRARCRP